MAALTIDFRCPYRGSLTPFDAISNKLRGLSEIENIKQRNARQCPKLAESTSSQKHDEALLTGNCTVMEGELLKFEVHHQRYAVNSPKQSLKIQRSTAGVDP